MPFQALAPHSDDASRKQVPRLLEALLGVGCDVQDGRERTRAVARGFRGAGGRAGLPSSRMSSAKTSLPARRMRQRS